MAFVKRNGQGAITASFAAIQPGDAEEWLEDDDAELSEYLSPSVSLQLPRPSLVATALLTVDAGEIDGLESAAGFGFGFELSTGVYWLFFAEEMPDTNYAYNVTASNGTAKVTARETSYMEVTVTDGGSPIEPDELSIQLFRAS